MRCGDAWSCVLYTWCDGVKSCDGVKLCDVVMVWSRVMLWSRVMVCKVKWCKCVIFKRSTALEWQTYIIIIIMATWYSAGGSPLCYKNKSCILYLLKGLEVTRLFESMCDIQWSQHFSSSTMLWPCDQRCIPAPVKGINLLLYVVVFQFLIQNGMPKWQN